MKAKKPHKSIGIKVFDKKLNNYMVVTRAYTKDKTFILKVETDTPMTAVDAGAYAKDDAAMMKDLRVLCRDTGKAIPDFVISVVKKIDESIS